MEMGTKVEHFITLKVNSSFIFLGNPLVNCLLKYWYIGEVQTNQVPPPQSCIVDQIMPFCEKIKQDWQKKEPDHSKN